MTFSQPSKYPVNEILTAPLKFFQFLGIGIRLDQLHVNARSYLINSICNNSLSN